MGWKTFYKIDESQFKRFYDEAKRWGDLYPMKVITSEKEYYGCGAYKTNGTFKLSPKIQHPIGVKTRITIKYLFLAETNAPAGSSSSIGVVFYKNSETSKDPQGNDFHGVSVLLNTSPPSTHVEAKTLTVEQDNNKIVIVYDGKSSEYQLEPPLQSFAVAIRVDSYTGIAVYEVTGEYYDFIEDIFNMMFNVMMIMMFIIIGVTIVGMIIRAFRGRK
ncbi:MAG: hypothetical protein QW503_02310 [Sulfolobales archaeon]